MRLRRMISLFVVLVLLLGMTGIVGISAEEGSPTARDLNSYLVVHYDFEGLTKAEAMKDKAPAGKTADNLSALDHQDVGGASSYISFDLDNGTVKRTRVWTQLTADVSEDILSLCDTATVLIRFKLPTLDANYPMLDLYNKTDSAPQTRFNTIGSGEETKFVGGYRTSTNGYLQYQVACRDMRTTESFINFVVTMNAKKTDNGDGTYTGELLYYASVGDMTESTEWFQIGTKTPTNNADTLPADGDQLLFTVLGYADGTAGKTDTVFDDIRIYNTVLTQDEIQTIRLSSSSGSGSTTTASEEVTTPTAEVTTPTAETTTATESDDSTTADADATGTTTVAEDTGSDSETDANTTEESSGCQSALSSGLWILTLCATAVMIPGIRRRGKSSRN